MNERHSFIGLKQAIDDLMSAEKMVRTPDALFGRQLAFLPLESWPPSYFHRAWQLLKRYIEELRVLGLSYELLEPPQFLGRDRYISRHPEEGFLIIFPKDERETREALRQLSASEYRSDPVPHWVIYPVQGVGKSLLDFTKLHRFLLAPGVREHAQECDIHPLPLKSRRIVLSHGSEGSTDAFDLYFPKSPEVLTDVKEEIPGRSYIDSPPHWQAPATPYAAQALLSIALKHQFSIDPAAVPLLQQLSEEARSLPPMPPVRRVEYDLKIGRFWLYFPWRQADFQEVRDGIAGSKFEDKEYGPRWGIPSTNVKGLRDLKAFLARHPEFSCPAEVRGPLERLQQEAEKQVQASRSQGAELVLPGLGGELRPFQKACVHYAIQARYKVLIGDDVGLGKTPEALAILLHAEAFPALIIVPAHLKYNWCREANLWLPGHSIRILDGEESQPGDYAADLTIINYDILTPRLSAMQSAFQRRGGLKGIVADECFPFKTQILTNRGILSIGEIVEHCLPVSVLSYNLEKRRAEWKPLVRYIKRRLQGHLVRVVHEHGSFVCTPNHRIWTEEYGYVMAEALQRGTCLRLVHHPFHDSHQRQEHCTLLHEILCITCDQQQPNSQRGNQQENLVASDQQSLRTMQGDLPNSLLWEEAERETPLLYHEMCGILEKPTTRTAGTTPCDCPKSSCLQSRKETSRRKRTDEPSQSNEQRGSSRKDEEKEDRDYLSIAWGEWYTDDSSTPPCQRFEIAYRISNHDRNGQRAVFLPSNLLQSGHCRSSEQNRNRSRWQNTSDETMEVSRQEQNCCTERARVVGVEILQSTGDGGFGGGSKRDYFVYNLEVADNHNYIADNVLVSNCHYIKEETALRTKAALALAENVPVRLALSGTALPNRPIELVSQLAFLDQLSNFGTFWGFVRRYCNAQLTSHGWDFNGNSNELELHEQLRAVCYIRRMRDDVLPELPPIQRQLVPVTIDNQEEYQQAERALITWLRDQVQQDKHFLATLGSLTEEERKIAISRRADSIEQRARRAEELRRIEILKQLAARGKMHAVRPFIERILATGEKLVVYASHIEIQQQIVEWFSDAATVLGETSAKKRDANTRRFQEERDCNLIICSLQAAREGLTLTAASKIVMAELGWNPLSLEQPEGRIRRMTQKAETLAAYYLLATDTIEPEILRLIEEKQQVIAAISDGREPMKSESVLGSILKILTKEGTEA